MLKLKKKTPKERSQTQEKTVAQEVSGVTVPASGAIDTFKGDVRSDLFLIECKTTEKDYYVLTFNTWSKICGEALLDNMREPLMQIDLNNGEKRLCVLNYDAFEDLIPQPDLDEAEWYNLSSRSVRLREIGIYVWKNYRNKKIIVVDWKYFLDVLLEKFDNSIIPF